MEERAHQNDHGVKRKRGLLILKGLVVLVLIKVHHSMEDLLEKKDPEALIQVEEITHVYFSHTLQVEMFRVKIHTEKVMQMKRYRNVKKKDQLDQ